MKALKDLTRDELLTFIYNQPQGDINIFDPLASCFVGGLGDSYNVKPEGGLAITPQQLLQLIDEGWTVIGTFSTQGGIGMDSLDEFKLVNKTNTLSEIVK